MAFTRKALVELGFNKEQIEKVMALHGTSMGNFISKSKMQSKIDEALKNASQPNIKLTDDYIELVREFENYKKKIEISAKLKEFGVKDKFIDNVFALIDDDKSIDKQLISIRENFEEYFDDYKFDGKNNLNKKCIGMPQFGAAIK